ncbi:hypothetical protein HZH66_007953 [Vespula vulgaris]|uniref:Uncharacterized protein n=1 Tax=Vespula vulgaris TaxID=7454 RepID=A0A834JUB0_VESVU|nr:hypothetical protein HZH66_007953 [Vespula vulgaris]
MRDIERNSVCKVMHAHEYESGWRVRRSRGARAKRLFHGYFGVREARPGIADLAVYHHGPRRGCPAST